MKKGFSLIELIIVIFLTVIFSALSLPYFNRNSDEKKLDLEAQHLVDIIELAKQKAAASAVSEINVPQCQTFRGYRILFTSATRYRLRACCSSVAQPTAKCAFVRDLQQYTLSNNISLLYSANLSSPNNYIHFPVLQLGTDLTSDVTIRVRNSSNSKCIPIIINRVGIVQINPKVSC